LEALLLSALRHLALAEMCSPELLSSAVFLEDAVIKDLMIMDDDGDDDDDGGGGGDDDRKQVMIRLTYVRAPMLEI